MKASVFNAYSAYYDLLYRDKDYQAEVDYIDALLRRYNVSGKNLLEFGSGTGKHGKLLAELGYDVTGIERSAEMVQQANSSQGFICQQGDICSVQLGRTFDAVLSLFHVLSYQTNNQSIESVFSRASEHLKPGGVFLFDIWYSPAVLTVKPEVRVKRISDDFVEVTRIAEPVLHPNTNCVDVNYNVFVRDLKSGEVDIITETHPMRHFSLPELDMFAENNGFERIGAEEFMSAKKPSEKTWGVCLVLKKK
jgi:SAM-dependent methyltransferase